MSSNIERRLRALEDARGCDECGLRSRAAFHVEWDHDLDDDDPDDGADAEPEYCSECGQPIVLVITWPEEQEQHLQRRRGDV